MTRRNKFPGTSHAVKAEQISLKSGENTIVDEVSLTVCEGEIALLTGPSGSGKSTVLRMIAGVEQPTSGSVKLFHQNVSAMTRREHTRLIAGRVGVGFQSPNLHSNLTGYENFFGLAEARGQDVDYEFAADLIGSLGLSGKLDRKSALLSGGEKMRLAIGRVLLPKPDLVLLDEPTGALDGMLKNTVMSYIAATCREMGAAALIVTHEESTVRHLADREYVMAGGQIVDEIKYSPLQSPDNHANLNPGPISLKV